MQVTPVLPPNPDDVLRAVDTYIKVAYEDAAPPLTVQSQLAVLRSWKGPFFRSPVIASDGGQPPKRYSIRLGNLHYPHMKLAIERSPDGQGYLFRADTHDAHCCPPAGHPEHAAFRKMMEQNQETASKVEAALAEQGLPTFKTYLQQDLARRQAAKNGNGGGAAAEAPAVPNPSDAASAGASGPVGA
jgi:hypothetical protein